VQIGMGKACKLNTVFNRYVEFCNEQFSSENIEVSDLEFLHVQLLDGQDTAENAALMKNDRISVRREQTDDRRDEEVRVRLQFDSDKEFFAQLSHLLPTVDTDPVLARGLQKCADVELDCRGSLPSVGGQPSFHAPCTIKCHAAFIHKRCPWLGDKLAGARREQSLRSVVTVTDEAKESEDEEDFDMLQQMKRREPQQNDDSSFAAQIENDDEENPKSPASNASVLSVVLEGHPPEAVKLLLEYIYTNRVISLGFDAFTQSCKTKSQCKKLNGPVPPFPNRPSRWPNNGNPTISFAAALAGIHLAEEANTKRLSFMCEIAAARLIDKTTTVDALTACEYQRKQTANPLPKLRAAAMEIILGARSMPLGGGMFSCLKDALLDKGRELVPVLLTGAMEAITEAEEKKKRVSFSSSASHHHHHLSHTLLQAEKRDWQAMAFANFDKYDRTDANQRERERKKHRLSKGNSLHSFDEEEDDEEDEMYGGYPAQARQMSLKRMSHHLEGRLGLILRDGNGLSRRGR
jgi:hypothetical protein